MRLFDPNAIDPTKLGPKDHIEPEFSFYQTSARPAIQRVRDLLESWFAVYPLDHQHELRRRMHSSKSDINSPFFELLLHQVFTVLGATVIVHPRVSDTITHRPDFLVCLPSGFQFYLEAIVTAGVSAAVRAQENAFKQVYNVIDARLQDRRFFLDVRSVTPGEAPPRTRKLVHDLEEFLSHLDPDEVARVMQEDGFDAAPRYVWEHEEWKIEFMPIPKKVEAREKKQRPLGAFPVQTVFSTAHQQIRDAVNGKLSHHGDLDAPYMIAVNATHWSADEEDYLDALYGSEAVGYTEYPDGGITRRLHRTGDGVWVPNQHLKNERLLGVLGVPGIGGVGPCSVAVRTLTLYQNPHKRHSLDAVLQTLRRWSLRDGQIVEIPGVSLGELFGLSLEWPKG